MSLETIDRASAARAFTACAGMDPEGKATPESAAAAGHCFLIATNTGEAVYSVAVRGNVLWCFAAAGTGQGMTAPGLAAMEAQAKASDCRAVAFQTIRRGLVRRAQGLGYKVEQKIGRGFVLKKEIA